jgi:hypothetical protein
MQQPSGEIGRIVVDHALAAWALAEAAMAAPKDASLAAARTKAIAYLVGLKRSEGWPFAAGGAIDAESTRWARLVLSLIQPEAVRSMPVPAGEPMDNYKRLTAILDAVRFGAKSPAVEVVGEVESSFDRFLRAIGRGKLKTVKTR